MHVTLIDQPARRIAGLAVRTSFTAVPVDAGTIWQRVIAEGLLAAGRPLFGVYTAYESDYRGAYTMLVGVETDDTPPGHEAVRLPAGRYARLAADGDPAVAVARTWQYVHGEWPDRERRAYVADFEIHGVRGPGTADVYVGIR